MGSSLPAYRRLDFYDALLIGVSMIPRAEIAMVIMQEALEAGAEPRAFTGMMGITSQMGADVTLNFKTCDVVDEIMKLPGGRGVDASIEAHWSPTTLRLTTSSTPTSCSPTSAMTC
ncbi:MAG: hypothetical protein ABR612_11505 [Chromatocurvus sp.]